MEIAAAQIPIDQQSMQPTARDLEGQVRRGHGFAFARIVAQNRQNVRILATRSQSKLGTHLANRFGLDRLGHGIDIERQFMARDNAQWPENL